MGELRAVIGKNFGDVKRTVLDQVPQESNGLRHSHAVVNLRIHIFAAPIDADEKIQFLFANTQLRDVNMHESRRVIFKLFLLSFDPFITRQHIEIISL